MEISISMEGGLVTISWEPLADKVEVERKVSGGGVGHYTVNAPDQQNYYDYLTKPGTYTYRVRLDDGEWSQSRSVSL